MNRKDIIEKLTIISSRVDGYFNYGDGEQVIPINDIITVSEIYLFGSTLYKESPRDIDLDIITHHTNSQKEYYLDWYKKIDPGYEDKHFWDINMLKTVLLEGMHKVHVNFPGRIGHEGYYPKYVHRLVWSRGKTNVSKNLEEIWSGEGDVYKDELIQLRDQLRIDQMYKRAFPMLWFFVKNDEKKKLIRKLAESCFYKKELPILKEVVPDSSYYGSDIEVTRFWEELVRYLESKQVGGFIPAYWDDTEQ